MHWGVEHEYSVWRAGVQVDFRVLLANLPLACLDPGDPRARRLPSGAALTADGWEAELATPPMPVSSGPDVVDSLLRRERISLREFVMGAGADRLRGFSTHLNLSVPDDRVLGLAHAIVPLVPALAALLEPARSCGVLVRPRRGRLEIGGEYAEGDPLTAALTFTGAVTAALLAGATPPSVIPPGVAPCAERFGWFIAPADLAAAPRAQLTMVWAWARDFAASLGLDPSPIDRVVAGAPLRREHSMPSDLVTFDATSAPLPPSDLGPRRRPGGLSLQTRWLTWQYAVWEVRDHTGPRAYVVMPATLEKTFLAELDAGGHDQALARFLARWRRRTLLVNAQIGDGGWWHDLRPGALVPAERRPDGQVPRVGRRQARLDHRRRSMR